MHLNYEYIQLTWGKHWEWINFRLGSKINVETFFTLIVAFFNGTFNFNSCNCRNQLILWATCTASLPSILTLEALDIGSVENCLLWSNIPSLSEAIVVIVVIWLFICVKLMTRYKQDVQFGHVAWSWTIKQVFFTCLLVTDVTTEVTKSIKYWLEPFNFLKNIRNSKDFTYFISRLVHKSYEERHVVTALQENGYPSHLICTWACSSIMLVQSNPFFKINTFASNWLVIDTVKYWKISIKWIHVQLCTPINFSIHCHILFKNTSKRTSCPLLLISDR